MLYLNEHDVVSALREQGVLGPVSLSGTPYARIRGMCGLRVPAIVYAAAANSSGLTFAADGFRFVRQMNPSTMKW